MSSKDIHIRAGANRYHPGDLATPYEFGGAIVFLDADGREALRFDPNGQVFVRGNPVDVDASIYQAFRGWLMRAKMELNEHGFTVSP